MEKSLIRNEIHKYVDKADDDFLEFLYSLIRTDSIEKLYQIAEPELTLIEERLLDYERNPSSGSTWEEVKGRLLKK